MKKLKQVLFIFCVLIFLTSACENETEPKRVATEEKPFVVVTLSFFEDMVQQVGGDKVETKALVPVGVEPEDYEPVPGDIRALNDACIFFYNGHNMERWLPRIIPDLQQKDNFYALAEHETIATIPLPDGPFAGQPDPHVWTDVLEAVTYIERIIEVLSSYDKTNEAYYHQQGEEYIARLTSLDSWIKENISMIPPERRILITSELCFQYYARAYGLYHDAIWPINAPEEGSPAQIIRIVNLVKDMNIPALFVENQVDHRPMQRVSQETGVPIAGLLFSDSLSKVGQGGETYIQMMESNTRTILAALGETEVEQND